MSKSIQKHSPSGNVPNPHIILSNRMKWSTVPRKTNENQEEGEEKTKHMLRVNWIAIECI